MRVVCSRLGFQRIGGDDLEVYGWELGDAPAVPIGIGLVDGVSGRAFCIGLGGPMMAASLA